MILANSNKKVLFVIAAAVPFSLPLAPLPHIKAHHMKMS